MSLKFNDAIELVAEKLLEVPKPNYEAYLQDAAEISEKFDQEFIKINSIFKGTVSNWNETAQLYNAEVTKLIVPALWLKMPFSVEPQRVHVFSSANFHPVNLKTSVSYPAVENGYLNGEKLTKLFIWDLNRVIDSISNVTCNSGKTYKLCTALKEHPTVGLIINILVKENILENGLQNFPSICYEFSLFFLFTNKAFSYTFSSNFFNQSKLSNIAAELKKRTKVMHNVKLMLQNLVNQPKISQCQMRAILNYIEIDSCIVGTALLEVIPQCIPHLQNPGHLLSAYGKLLQFKQSDSVQLTELMAVFGLK